MLSIGTPRHAGEQVRRRLAGFVGFLHANGYGVGGGDALRAVQAGMHAGVLERDVLRWSLRALLCGRPDEWRRFDALFDAYFLPPNRRARTEDEQAPQARGDAADTVDSAVARDGASPEPSLADTDFGELARADDTGAVEALMRRFARRVKRLLLRRELRSHRGRRLDLQGTIRRSVATGGTPLRLAWTRRRRVRPRLVLLLDVSASMSLYSFFWLRIARALCAELADVHAFVFHTRLTPVSDALRDPDPWRAQVRLHLLSEGWGGGTRIGESLEQFTRDHAPRLVHARTAVIVVSDGFDAGEPALLAHALATLRRRARRVVWLNPLLDQPGYRPESRGMRAAMPHLDLLAAGADVASLDRVLPDVIEALR
jgi:uncharacterized protein with von Willebrand factor type A (vWA) domain